MTEPKIFEDLPYSFLDLSNEEDNEVEINNYNLPEFFLNLPKTPIDVSLRNFKKSDIKIKRDSQTERSPLNVTITNSAVDNLSSYKDPDSEFDVFPLHLNELTLKNSIINYFTSLLGNNKDADTNVKRLFRKNDGFFSNIHCNKLVLYNTNINTGSGVELYGYDFLQNDVKYSEQDENKLAKNNRLSFDFRRKEANSSSIPLNTIETIEIHKDEFIERLSFYKDSNENYNNLGEKETRRYVNLSDNKRLKEVDLKGGIKLVSRKNPNLEKIRVYAPNLINKVNKKNGNNVYQKIRGIFKNSNEVTLSYKDRRMLRESGITISCKDSKPKIILYS